jgi:zinc protease
MTILARENFASPAVVLSGYLIVGALDEDPEQAGLADLTASCLMRGTEQRAFNQIFEEIESIGARLSISASRHTTGFSGKALSEDLRVILKLLSEVLRTPTFPKTQFELLRAEKLTGLAIRDQDTRSRAAQSFNEMAYVNHPYAIPVDGYPESIGSIRPKDLREFHRSKYSPTDMVLCVVGAIDTEAAIDAVKEQFGDWEKNSRSAQPGLPDISLEKKKTREHILLDGKSQCDIVMGAVGPRRRDPSFLAAALANSILGRFGMMGRIGDAVREQAGLAYYAYSSVIGGTGPGPWQMMAGVHPSKVERAIELISAEARRIAEKPVTPRELYDNQAHFIGRLPLQLETNEGVAGSLINVERHDLGLDYYQRYPELIASLTRKDILEATSRFLDTEQFVIASSGPALPGG